MIDFADINTQAREAGFDAVGIASIEIGERERQRLEGFIATGQHGDMDWMATHLDRRRSPRDLWPDVRSVIVLGMNYGPDEDPLSVLSQPDRGGISVYARHRDYHDIVKKRLKQVARWLVTTAPCEVKVFVDTAPVPEKALAQAIRAATCLIDFDTVMIDGSFPETIRADVVARTRRHLAAQPLPGVTLPALREGTVGSDARALGAASLPLSDRFLVDRDAFLKG